MKSGGLNFNLCLVSADLLLRLTLQIVQTLSAVDRDEPGNGHHFLFSLTAEASGNLSFTLRDNNSKVHLKNMNYREVLP